MLRQRAEQNGRCARVAGLRQIGHGAACDTPGLSVDVMAAIWASCGGFEVPTFFVEAAFGNFGTLEGGDVKTLPVLASLNRNATAEPGFERPQRRGGGAAQRRFKLLRDAETPAGRRIGARLALHEAQCIVGERNRLLGAARGFEHGVAE
jgi:hypothetical protein